MPDGTNDSLTRSKLVSELGQNKETKSQVQSILNKNLPANDDLSKMIDHLFQKRSNAVETIVTIEPNNAPFFTKTEKIDKNNKNTNVSIFDINCGQPYTTIEGQKISTTGSPEMKAEAINRIINDMKTNLSKADKQVAIIADGIHYVTMVLMKDKKNNPLFIYDDSYGNDPNRPLPIDYKSALKKNSITQIKVSDVEEQSRNEDNHTCGLRSVCNAAFYALTPNEKLIEMIDQKSIFNNKLPCDIKELNKLAFRDNLSPQQVVDNAPILEEVAKSSAVKQTNESALVASLGEWLPNGPKKGNQPSTSNNPSNTVDEEIILYKGSPQIEHTSANRKDQEEAATKILTDLVKSDESQNRIKDLFSLKTMSKKVKKFFNPTKLPNAKDKDEFLYILDKTNPKKKSQQMEKEMMETVLDGRKTVISKWNEKRKKVEVNEFEIDHALQDGTIFLVGEAAKQYLKLAKTDLKNNQDKENHLYNYALGLASSQSRYKNDTFVYESSNSTKNGDALENFLLKGKINKMVSELQQRKTRETEKNDKETNTGNKATVDDIKEYREKKIELNKEFISEFQKLATSENLSSREFEKLNKEYLQKRNELRKEYLPYFSDTVSKSKFVEKNKRFLNVDRALKTKENRNTSSEPQIGNMS
jgi:hypothetical protein